MRRDRTKSILSIIATLVSIVLILIYWLVPADKTSHSLYKLFIDCIPDSIVVLITIPIVYWLLYRRGLTNMGDCPLFTGHSPVEHKECHSRPGIGALSVNSPEPGKDADKEHDILLVAVLKDHSAWGQNTDKIATSINDTLRRAEVKGMPVVFTRCNRQTEQASVENNPAKQAAGAEHKSYGAELPNNLYRPAGSAVFEFCVEPKAPAFEAPKKAALDMLISNPTVNSVYVIGIASECCIRAICKNALRHDKRTISITNAITIPDKSIEQSEEMWRDLTAEGLVRQESLS